MNRLSATDAFAPAFARVRAMLFRPFRLGMWLKIGLIGLLGGAVVSGGGGSNFRAPVMPRKVPQGDLPHNVDDILRAIRSIHLADYFHIIVIVIAVIVVLALIFLYLFCRFRFILFDTVITGRAEIARGWQKYESQANRYFGFWLVFKLVTWGAFFLIVGWPLWRAYKNGLFSGDGRSRVGFSPEKEPCNQQQGNRSPTQILRHGMLLRIRRRPHHKASYCHNNRNCHKNPITYWFVSHSFLSTFSLQESYMARREALSFPTRPRFLSRDYFFLPEVECPAAGTPCSGWLW